MSAVRAWIRRAIRPVRDDLGADPRLRYVLLVAVVACGFGIWFRVPNFAGPDEYSRLIQPMKAAGRTAADPGLESLRAGVLDGRALGATFYLYGLTLAPVFLYVLATGRLGEFARLGALESRWDLWHEAPSWFWTSSVLLGRLATLALAVASVYLVYRLGTELRDRTTGLIGALLLAVSPGFFSQAHLVGEDVPMLFCLLVAILLAGRYARSGRRDLFLAGCLFGGLAIAFKLSGGVAAIALGVAHLERARRSDAPLETLADPVVLGGGAAVGLATIAVGIPSVLVGGPGEILGRAGQSISSKTTRSGGLSAPIWYWFVRQYVSGVGLPLFLAATAGTVATLRHQVRRDRPVDPLAVILAVSVLSYVLVYSRWEFVRTRHLLPTFPALLLFLGAAVSRWDERPDLRRVARVGFGVVLVATLLFAGAAEYQYVAEPRDRATQWVNANVGENETVEVYENSVADVGVPHGTRTVHYDYPEESATNQSSLVLNESAYTEWMLGLSDRESDYVQLVSGDLRYLDETDPASREYPERREHVRRLVEEEGEYRIAASFGTHRQRDTLREDFLREALSPTVDGTEEYVVILERREG